MEDLLYTGIFQHLGFNYAEHCSTNRDILKVKSEQLTHTRVDSSTIAWCRVTDAIQVHDIHS